MLSRFDPASRAASHPASPKNSPKNSPEILPAIMPEISPDILVVSRTFFPNRGGIEEYVYHRCLQDPSRVIVASADCPDRQDRNNFDSQSPFPIHRWFVPSLLQGRGLVSVLRQIHYLICSVILSICLYFRYRYRYIEWGHGYDFPSLLLLSYLLPIRYFIYLHGDDVLCPLRNPVLKWLFELTLQRSSGVVCNSSFTRDYVLKHFRFDTPTYILNPTVRPEKFGDAIQPDRRAAQRTQVRETFQIPPQAVVVLSVGRLVRRKGFDRVMRQIPALVEAGCDVHYLICGKGPLAQELQTLAQELEIADRVHFAGYVPDEQLADYYSACDLFALITVFDQQAASIEGFGIVYLEAGFFGKPVIASRIGGVVDAVIHGETGLLVDPLSESELADAFLQLCHDSSLRSRLGQRGRELAQRQTPHRCIYAVLESEIA